MGRLADLTAIHTRTLNASKGVAVQSLRVQNERDGYAAAARELVERAPNVAIVRAEIAEIAENMASPIAYADKADTWLSGAHPLVAPI